MGVIVLRFRSIVDLSGDGRVIWCYVVDLFFVIFMSRIWFKF